MYISIPSNYIPLKAAQVTTVGILVEYEAMPGKLLWIYNDNQKENSLADGAAIEAGNFSYEGTYSYTSMTGPHRVYAFRRK